MLIRFNVKNFLSYSVRKDPVSGSLVSNEFSMIPGRVRNKQNHIINNTKQDLLKFAAIYGANASGKSNIVKALDFMQNTIKNGKTPSKSSEKYSKTQVENKSKPSYFSIEVLIDSRSYEYGFEVVLQTGEFISEWLYEIGKDQEKLLFEKLSGSNIYNFANDLQKIVNLKIYAQDMAGSNTLFLSIMNQNKMGFYKDNPKAQILALLYDWFNKHLDINYPDRPISNFSYLTDIDAIPRVAQLLSAFSTGIAEIKPITISKEEMLASLPIEIKNDIIMNVENVIKAHNYYNEQKKDIDFTKWNALIRTPSQLFTFEIDNKLNQIAQEIKFIHTNKNFSFSFSEESDGTVRLFDLIEILVSKDNKTYIIDELDRCMHPSLTYKFVETFLNYATQSKKQLIVSSHESRLLDFNLLRKDEIWFVDKNSDGESILYSLDEYNVRFDKVIDKAYLEGRYGGVPVFTTFFPVTESTE